MRNRIFLPIEKIPAPIKKFMLRKYKRSDRVLTNMPFDKSKKKQTEKLITVENKLEC